LIKERLSEGDDSLSRASSGTLDHDEIFANHSVMMEATDRVDGFLSDIELSRTTLVVRPFSKSVDLFVDFCSMEISSLTSTGYSILDSARMPCSNTSDLSETLVSFSRKFGNSPSLDDTFKPMSFGDTDNVDHFIFVKDGFSVNWFFKKILGKVDFLSNSSSVNLDLH